MTKRQPNGPYDDAHLERLYDRFAPMYRWVAMVNDGLFGVSSLRRHTMRHAAGRVLDVACGTGQNFPHLRSVSSVTAVDLSTQMLRRARRRAGQLGMDVDLRQMSAQSLDFDDDAFDTVTTAMSTCTFPDPVAALQQMSRVCRPGGRLLLVEHGRSDVGWIARLQDRRADRHYRQAGCRWNQDVGAVLAAAGVHIDTRRSRTFGVFTGIVSDPVDEHTAR